MHFWDSRKLGQQVYGPASGLPQLLHNTKDAGTGRTRPETGLKVCAWLLKIIKMKVQVTVSSSASQHQIEWSSALVMDE